MTDETYRSRRVRSGRSLPVGYRARETLDVGHAGGWRITAGVSLLGLALLVGGGQVLGHAARWLSPAFAAAQGADPATATFGSELAIAVRALPAPALRSLAEGAPLPVQALVWGLGLLLSLALYLLALHVFHEGAHALVLWAFSGRRPQLGFTGWAATVALPGCFLTRLRYVAAELAPLVLLTAGGLAVVPWTPPVAVPVLLTLLVLNAVGSAGDLLTAGWVLTRRGAVLVAPRGTQAVVYAADPPAPTSGRGNAGRGGARVSAETRQTRRR